MGITIAHGGDIEYIAETTHGGGLPSSGQLEIPSDSVRNIELAISSNVERHKTVSDYDSVDTSYHSREYTLTIEYALQQCNTSGSHTSTTALENYAVTRTSGDLTSLAFVYSTNGSYYLLKGGKINSWSMPFALNESLIVTVEIWGTEIETATSASTFTNYSSLTASETIGNAFEVYGGGAITRSGKWSNGIKAGTLTISNNLERVPKIGTQDMIGVYPQEIDVGLSCDILTDSGGKTDIDDLLTPDETDIVIQSGTTSNTSYKWTLTNPSYNSEPVVYKVGMSHMVISADIGAEAITYTTVS